MKSKSLLFACLLLISGSVCSQEERNSGVLFNGISYGVGPYSVSSGFSSLATFKSLAPKSEFLNVDLTDFDNSNSFYDSQTNTMIGGAAHFKVIGKEKPNRLFSQSFRIGISFTDQSTFYNSYSRSETFTVDTLTSNTTGIQYPIDSTATERLSMDYYQTQLYIDAAYLFQTGEINRFSLYGGLGAMVGFTIDAYTSVRLSEDFTYSANSPRQFSDPDIAFDFKEENYKNKGGIAFITYIPVGLDFRIGNKGTFWKNSHLGAEVRPSIYINQIPELETEVTTAMIGMFIYRYQFR
tara:strand:+ start:1320 stop:2204 length:885 start_codon:yes stop_codon:yes gene_type:complete